MIECNGVLPPGIALGDMVRVHFANGEQDVGLAGEMNWRHVSGRSRDWGYNIVRCEVIARYPDEASQQPAQREKAGGAHYNPADAEAVAREVVKKIEAEATRQEGASSEQQKEGE